MNRQVQIHLLKYAIQHLQEHTTLEILQRFVNPRIPLIIAREDKKPCYQDIQ